MSLFQWIGSSDADLGNGSNWADTTEPGMGQPPGPNDVAIIQVGQGLYGTLNVSGLDIVQASGAPTISITGSSTQITAASVGIGLGFTLDTGAYLQAGTLGIDGDGTAVTVQNNALLYDKAGLNDVLSIGASAGSASLLLTKGGTMYYYSPEASGALDLGGVSNSTATMTVSAGGYFSAALSSVNIGAAADSSGTLIITGADSQFLINNYGDTVIGDYGEFFGDSAQGTVEVTAGAYASLSSDDGVFIGTSAGMAEVLVSGANSDLEAGPSVYIGESGTNIAGEILVQTGGEFDTGTDTLLENGTISVTGANSLYTGRIMETYAGTLVKVTTGGLIHIADADLYGEVSLTAGSLNVRESLTMYSGSEIVGAGTITAASIENSGNIIAGGGTLVVNGPISSAGYDKINSAALLQLNGAVASGQSIVFDSGANTLALEDPSAVAATILDFATGDAIDLLSKAATKLSYASGVLTVSNGTTLVAKLDVKGSYKTANFKLASDGHGGSLISYVAGSTGEPRPIGDPIAHMVPQQLVM